MVNKQETPTPSGFHRHSNGGGLVADTAQVTETAYVGPDAQVYGNARVSGNAQVSGNARVFENAQVSGNVRVHEDARVYGNAQVHENARVSGNAQVFENARVHGNAWVHENARVYGNARVHENARVYGNAWVCENAWVYENAWVFNNARVSGNAWVFNNARVSGNAWVFGNAWVKHNLSKDFLDKTAGIVASFNIYPDLNNFYLFYKRVSKITDTAFRSVYDKSFIYILGAQSVVKDADQNPLLACGRGLHISMPNYQFNGDTLLQVAVHKDSIISWMEGKVRCSALIPVRVINEEEKK